MGHCLPGIALKYRSDISVMCSCSLNLAELIVSVQLYYPNKVSSTFHSIPLYRLSRISSNGVQLCMQHRLVNGSHQACRLAVSNILFYNL